MQESWTKRSRDFHMNSFDCTAQLSSTALCWRERQRVTWAATDWIIQAAHMQSQNAITNHPRRWRAEGSKTIRGYGHGKACVTYPLTSATATLTYSSAIIHMICSVHWAFHIITTVHPTKQSKQSQTLTDSHTQTKTKARLWSTNSRFSSSTSFC